MVRKRLDLAQIMDKYGGKFENLVIARVKAGDIPPPLRRATIKAKKSSKTLIDSTNLMGSIKRKPWAKGNLLGCRVGIFDESIASYAVVHEFGYPANDESTDWDYLQIIPTRSFLRVPFDEHFERLCKEMNEEISKTLEANFIAKR